MTGAERCAAVFEALRAAGIECLVMGGHAVRFFGVDRNTIDYDLVASSQHWDDLESRIGSAGIVAEGCTLTEGPSWRIGDFRRFIIGVLPNGQEERLEFWRTNHLLAPFEKLVERSRIGAYGGRQVQFLGLQDLLRSKETEREDDWRDISLLEERADEEELQRARAGDVANALSRIRSKRGFQTAQSVGYYSDVSVVRASLALASHPIALAFAVPYAPSAPVIAEGLSIGMQDVFDRVLREVTAGSPKHLALVEVVRRLHKRNAMDVDRADKMRLSGGA